MSDEHLQELMSMPAATTARTDKLIYRNDSPLPCPHHVKTTVAQSEGRIFTLEANTGKPFLLAPELLMHSSEDELVEMSGATIAQRQSMSVASDLRTNLVGFKTPKDRYASVAEAINSHGNAQEPLGRNAASMPTLAVSAPTSQPRLDLNKLF